MQWSTRGITSSDRRQVAEAVAAAEAVTAAEIVPVLAARSALYSRAADLIGLWSAVALLTIVWMTWTVETPDPHSWDDARQLGQLGALVAAVVVGFFGGAVLGARLPALRRLFVSQSQRREQTWARAVQVFHDRRISRTTGRTGLLVYLSLFERTAAIVADDAVMEKLGQPEIDKLCRLLVEQTGRSSPIAALCSTIAAAGSQLAISFPAAASRGNELSDALIVLD